MPISNNAKKLKTTDYILLDTYAIDIVQQSRLTHIKKIEIICNNNSKFLTFFIVFAIIYVQ
ncbi:MAG: hypothetical protein B6U87_00515 [Candidatus Aenigmarchaeota archaeon ex4484_52]|nr:MAG: hypothetical protein B6U87_00515 [Candidatus Aenigmarchaeota archaeon ex4484_52]